MKTLLKNLNIINENAIYIGDILIDGVYIESVSNNIAANPNYNVIDMNGKYAMPGIIDDQVHFRQPGLTHKADIASESRAGVAGGVTSYMEMPNTIPQATTIEELEKKYEIAKNTSFANYSFYLGGTNDNAEIVKTADPKNICGVKVFMGSSTGDMLVDSYDALYSIFSNSPMIIAIHSEREEIVKANMREFLEKYGEDMPAHYHPLIRSREACIKSTEFAIDLAKSTNAKLHVLHISTAEEANMFELKPLQEKRITSEACVHFLYFNSNDYDKLGNKIKCNPAIKNESDRLAIFHALKEGRIDVIATDHAPHTLDEKNQVFAKSPSGLPLLQHSLQIMLDLYHKGQISLEQIVDKMCHKPAMLFDINRRGYLREGYFADIAIFDLDTQYTVEKNNILYKCGWSPLEGMTFRGQVTDVFVSGAYSYRNGQFTDALNPMRLSFDR